MAQRKSLAWAELRVGALVIASFVLLALAIFFIGGGSGFLTPKYTVTAYFSSANGLRNGAEVRLEGVTIGNVQRVNISELPDPTRAVAVEMRLQRTYQNRIRSDSEVSIGTIGLLGDQIVDVTSGTAAGQPVPDGGSLQGVEAGDIKKIITGTNDFIANLDVLSDKVVQIADRIDRGEGTLGKFLTDESIFNNANLAAGEANRLVRDARTGRGTIGRLMQEDELYQRLNNTIDNANSIITTIQHGDGTIAKFMNDPSLYNEANQLVAKMQSVMDRIDRGEGTLGKLSKDDAIYNDIRQTMQRVTTLMTSIENGQGTAGKLIKDPALYNSLNQTSSEILKLLYDFRQDPRKFLTINFRLF
jgi:phospholipid/cholesterol/gamma-HCH transport system substrate-binding protein